MSIDSKKQLSVIAKNLCRELRKNATPAEQIFWEVVRNRRFLNKKFYRQYPIFFDLLGKETFFIADFYCFEEKLVVEIDGGYHKRQQDYDEMRTKIINFYGINVVRFPNDEVRDDIERVKIKLENIICPPSLIREGDGG